jgi:hypothetical protein
VHQLPLPDGVVSVGRTLDALHSATATGANPATLWACSLADDRRAASVIRRLAEGLDRLQASSADLGQALFGLMAASERFPEERQRARLVADGCAQELLACFSPSADLFEGTPRGIRLRLSMIERELTSFAAQVYSLHG